MLCILLHPKHRNTAAELKDRHDSSTEEETETKTARPASPIADACKMEFEKDFKLTEADGWYNHVVSAQGIIAQFVSVCYSLELKCCQFVAHYSLFP